MSLHARPPPPPLPLELPLEIQFLILDEMKSDNNSELQRLAFVCLAWSNHIQSLLFQQVNLVDAANVCTSRFLSVLRTNSRLGQYTTHLKILPEGLFNSSDLQPFLPNLHTITTGGETFGPLNKSAPAWSTVRELRLRFHRPSPVVDVWRIITRFPTLERLLFIGWLSPTPGKPAAKLDADAPVVHLKRLALVSTTNFSAQPAVPRLCAREIIVDTLSVTVGSMDCDASLYNRLVRKVGPTLHDLQVFELPEHVAPFVGISLAACTSLRRLTLRLRFSTTSPQTMRLGLIPMLHQVPPTLGTLTLKMSLSPALFDLPWEEVDQILACGLPSGVERVVFAFMSAYGPGPGLLFRDVAAAMKERIVGLQRRRLLHFERSVL